MLQFDSRFDTGTIDYKCGKLTTSIILKNYFASINQSFYVAYYVIFCG